jgi:energy-converting hydrogenase Eha subunit H
MPVSDIVLLLGAIGVLITTVTTAILTLRRVDTVKEQVETVKAEIKGDVKAVHKIVNQQRTDMLAYQEKLVIAIRAAGLHVPTDDSLKDK